MKIMYLHVFSNVLVFFDLALYRMSMIDKAKLQLTIKRKECEFIVVDCVMYVSLSRHAMHAHYGIYEYK
mgnify:CR=1 FL=1